MLPFWTDYNHTPQKHAAMIMCTDHMNDRVKSKGTIAHLHTWLSKWPPPKALTQGSKRDPIPPFKFLGWTQASSLQKQNFVLFFLIQIQLPPKFSPSWKCLYRSHHTTLLSQKPWFICNTNIKRISTSLASVLKVKSAWYHKLNHVAPHNFVLERFHCNTLVTCYQTFCDFHL